MCWAWSSSRWSRCGRRRRPHGRTARSGAGPSTRTTGMTRSSVCAAPCRQDLRSCPLTASATPAIRGCREPSRVMAVGNYTEEFRRQAVDLYRSSPGATLRGIAADLGISRRALQVWVHGLVPELDPGPTSPRPSCRPSPLPGAVSRLRPRHRCSLQALHALHTRPDRTILTVGPMLVQPYAPDPGVSPLGGIWRRGDFCVPAWCFGDRGPVPAESAADQRRP